ncbi:hypothetical protein HN873_046968, partial [Arachis hypogaea]
FTSFHLITLDVLNLIANPSSNGIAPLTESHNLVQPHLPINVSHNLVQKVAYSA